MNSIKTIIVVLVFLGVVYGVYQLINGNNYSEDGSPMLTDTGQAIATEFDESMPDGMQQITGDEAIEAILNGNFPASSNEESSGEPSGAPELDFNFGTGEEEADDNEYIGTPADTEVGFTPPTDFQPEEFAPQNFSSSPANEAPPLPDYPGDVETIPAPQDFGSQGFQPTQPEEDFSGANFAPSDPASDLMPETNPGFTPPTDFNAGGDFALPQPETNLNIEDAGESSNFTPSSDQPLTETQESYPLAEMRNQTDAASPFTTPNGVAPNVVAADPTESEFSAPETNGGFSQPEVDPNLKSDEAATMVAERFDNRERFTQNLQKAWSRASHQIQTDKFREALETLSSYYGDSRLTAEEQKNLLSWLDPLAGKVIYSTEHLVTSSYTIRVGESLRDIANKFEVPPQLLYNINKISIPDPRKMVAGTQLKVVKGPFNAEISLSENKLTLFAGKLYAGHFLLTLGEEGATPGNYKVIEKSNSGHEYSSRSGTIAAGSADNPYGKFWIGLDNNVSIHGSPSTGATDDRRGCLSLSPIDIEDVYGILSVGSTVTISER